MEFVYVLRNPSYEPYVVKIGRTKATPVIRAKQIYWGATGVPEHFEVAYFCGVPDCVKAEKYIHQVLASYRKNKRREFFHLPVQVAKKTVLSVCLNLFGSDNISVFIDEKSDLETTIENTEEEYSSHSVVMDISNISQSPINTSILTEKQKQRVITINDVFCEVFPNEESKALENFSRDHNPDREIEIWEHMAKAFMKVSTQPFLTKDFREEAFKLLLMRSASHTKHVLINRTSIYIDDKQAKLLLKAYELKPKPLRVVAED
ncbi:GIY-YIG nuclease family protein [Pseudoalteromonas sp. Ld20]|uniref:GIY-YIG nuclease family protein n=1 Tax=Pseudoalteromonas sp. Ld20 TaxID=649165 RepID=UPI00386CD92E